MSKGNLKDNRLLVGAIHSRPLAFLFVLAAYVVAGTLPAKAQTTFPGEKDPIGSQPSRLTQFHDDEFAFVSSAPDDTTYYIQEFSPNPDYTLPPGPTSDRLDYEPSSSQLTGQANGYQRLFNVAKGRIVDPTRDVAVTLSKVGFDAGSIRSAMPRRVRTTTSRPG